MKTLPKRPTDQWFIHPLDADTNEIIARELARLSEVDEVETELGSMYRCAYARIEDFQNAKEKYKLRFRVYRRRTSGSKLEEWKFGYKKTKTKRSAKYQKAKTEAEKKKK